MPGRTGLSVHCGGAPESEALRGAIVRIHRPGASPMQAGPVRAREWVLEFEPQGPSEIEPLMGWISSKDPLQQVRVVFQRLEEAISYCERRGLSFTIEKPARHKPRLRSYAENFLPSERTSITPTPVP